MWRYLGILLWILSTSGKSETLVLSISPNFNFAAERQRFFQLIEDRIPGLHIELKELPLARGLYEANIGKVDGDAGRMKNAVELFPKLMENLIQVKEPIYQLEFYLIHRRGEPIFLDKTRIGQNRIAYLTGIIYLDHKLPAFNQVHVNEDKQAMNLLEQKKVDAYIKLSIGRDVAENLSKAHDMELVPEPVVRGNVYAYLHKKHVLYVPKFEEAILSLRRDGLLPAVAVRKDLSE